MDSREFAQRGITSVVGLAASAISLALLHNYANDAQALNDEKMTCVQEIESGHGQDCIRGLGDIAIDADADDLILEGGGFSIPDSVAVDSILDSVDTTFGNMDGISQVVSAAVVGGVIVGGGNALITFKKRKREEAESRRPIVGQKQEQRL